MKTTNTVPYTNARRAGRTNPDLVEFIKRSDPRAQGPRLVPNRSDLRARGVRRGVTRKGASGHRVHRDVWPPQPTDEQRAALADYQADRWFKRHERFAAGIYRCPCGFRMCWGKDDVEHYDEIAAHEAVCTWDAEVSA